MISFFVPGHPKGKGDKRIGPHGQMYEAGGHELAAWLDTVATYAMAARQGKTFDGAVGVRLVYQLARGGNGGVPDGDKLERAILDALTRSRLIRDDGLVVDCHWTKFPAYGPRRQEGVRITVWEIHRLSNLLKVPSRVRAQVRRGAKLVGAVALVAAIALIPPGWWLR